MPRGSLKHEDASQGFGFQEGNFEIVKSVVAIHQFPPNSKTGKQSDPFTCVRWTGYKLDEDWKRVDGDDAEQLVIPIRLGVPMDLRPGKLVNPDDLDEEPEDLGKEVDTEGNSIYAEEGKRVFGSWPEMESSLRKCGFKAEVVGRGCATDFEGMKAHFKTVSAGRKYTDKTTGEEKDATNLVCDRINVFPYEAKKGGKTVGKAVGKSATTGKPVAAPSDGNALESAKGLLSAPSDKFREMVPVGKAVKRNVFQMQVAQELMRKKVGIKEHGPILNLVKDDEKLMELAGEVGFMVDFDEGTVTFA